MKFIQLDQLLHSALKYKQKIYLQQTKENLEE